MEIKLVMSRRNLTALLNKLDRNVSSPGSSQCTLILPDEKDGFITVHAVEDSVKYAARLPGVCLDV